MKIVFNIYYCNFNSKGPRLEVANALGQTPLLLLVSQRAVEAVEELVRRGANIHRVDCNGESFLFYALGSGFLFERFIKIYNNKGGNINLVNNNGVK